MFVLKIDAKLSVIQSPPKFLNAKIQILAVYESVVIAKRFHALFLYQIIWELICLDNVHLGKPLFQFAVQRIKR